MRKAVLVARLVLFGLVAAGGLYFWNEMQKPLYEPGMVRAGTNLRAPLAPPAQPAGGDFWLVEPDIKLYHFAAGTGTGVLVVHGGPGYPFAQPLPGLQPLTSHYRFYYYDQRGSSKSSRPIDRFTSSNYYENMQSLDRTLGLGAQLADIERIRRLLGEDRLILVGHSFGGFLASLYAAEFPERVRALVLVAPAETLVMPPPSGGLFEQVRTRLASNVQGEYDAYLKRYLDYGSLFSRNEADLAALNTEFARYYDLAARQKGFSVPAESSPGAGGGWMVQAMYMSMGLKHDYRPALKKVSAPVLVVHGGNDLQPEQASRMYADAFPNSQFQVIAGAGHFVFSDKPAEFARVVGDFLAGVQQ